MDGGREGRSDDVGAHSRNEREGGREGGRERETCVRNSQEPTRERGTNAKPRRTKQGEIDMVSKKQKRAEAKGMRV